MAFNFLPAKKLKAIRLLDNLWYEIIRLIIKWLSAIAIATERFAVGIFDREIETQ